MKQINCFIPYGDAGFIHKMVTELGRSDEVDTIFLMTANREVPPVPGTVLLYADDLWSSEMIRQIGACSTTGHTLLYTGTGLLRLGLWALERMLAIAGDTSAGLLYADYYKEEGDAVKPYPVIDYQKGSLRDDFNFGPLLLYRSEAIREAVASMTGNYRFAGLYDLRLKVSQKYPVVHMDEFLYTEAETGGRVPGEKQFAYVDPKNREVQIEMEEVCTDHLKRIGGYLEPVFKSIDLYGESFEYEASVIIPVRNRIRTIGDAIRSVLKQKTSFPFNLLIVDNHSTDGTTPAIEAFAADKRVFHLRPEREDLGIGGCWNVGIHHPECGKFAIQLDSDDIYSDENTLQKIVDAFYAQQCPMIIGTYQITDFQLKTIPPGTIDHREWTPENGRNNALRINGLGAPRAFYTPLVRKLCLPNTSYGEDYALGLRISREYLIARVYDVLYFCRRWEGNSDASLDVRVLNRYNFYKDKVRTWELEARIKQR